MRSIQNCLTIYIVASTALVLLAVALVIDAQLSRQLEEEFNRNLLAKAMTMVTLTEQDEGKVEFDLVEDLTQEFKPGERAEYVQLLFQDGTVLSKSSSLGAARLEYDAAGVEPAFVDLVLPDGRPGRMVTFRFIPIDDSAADDKGADEGSSAAATRIREDPSRDDDAENSGKRAALVDDGDEKSRPAGGNDGDPGSADEIWMDLALAQGKEPLGNLLGTMRTTLLLSFLLLMALLAALARLSIHAGLRPLRDMSREVESIGASNLDMRLTTGTGIRELSPITARLNDLLGRLEEAFKREKRFSGNVAHELRTPIAELRALAEVGREWPSEEEMVAGFFGDLIDVADDMERTVVNLLMLARLDAGNQEAKREAFDLYALVANVCDKFKEQAHENGLRIDTRVERPLHVSTDKDKLKLILMNVVYNAISYSPSGSTVVIETNGHGGEVELVVSNEAVDLSEEDICQMFERFWRKDQARTTSSHAGLGLSLVQALSELLGLTVRPTLGSGSRFSLSLLGLAPA